MKQTNTFGAFSHTNFLGTLDIYKHVTIIHQDYKVIVSIIYHEYGNTILKYKPLTYLPLYTQLSINLTAG